VLSLYAKGLTTGEISAHFAQIYGASVSKETISRITDKVLEEMNDWQNRLPSRRRNERQRRQPYAAPQRNQWSYEDRLRMSV
jgi:transposase-like protein